MFTLAKLTVVISKPYKYLVYLGGNLCLKFMKTVNGKIHIKKIGQYNNRSHLGQNWEVVCGWYNYW